MYVKANIDDCAIIINDFLPDNSAPKAIPTACPSFVAITCSKSDSNIEF